METDHMEKLHIENLNQYIDALHACDLGIFEYEHVALSALVNLADVAHLIQWNADHFSRITIEKTDHFELLLLCWQPGQGSQIHDHNGQNGWMKIIQGELTEEVFVINETEKPLQYSTQRSLLPLHTYHTNDAIGPHRITNNSNENCLSVHLYVHPVKSMHVYDETTGSSSVKRLTTDN